MAPKSRKKPKKSRIQNTRNRKIVVACRVTVLAIYFVMRTCIQRQTIFDNLCENFFVIFCWCRNDASAPGGE
jgi:hypothetical protein